MIRQHHCSWQFFVRISWWFANTTVHSNSLFASADDSPTPLFIAILCSQHLMTRQRHCSWQFFVHNTWWLVNTTGQRKSLFITPDDSPTPLFIANLCWQHLMTRQHHWSVQIFVLNTWWLANTTVRGSSLFATPDDSPGQFFVERHGSGKTWTELCMLWPLPLSLSDLLGLTPARSSTETFGSKWYLRARKRPLVRAATSLFEVSKHCL